MTAGRWFPAGSRQGLLCILLIASFIASCHGIAAFAQAGRDLPPQSSSTSIRTPDFDESVRWYQDKLGFRLIADRSLVTGRTAVLERSGFLLEISEADHVLPQLQEPDATATSRAARHPVVTLLVQNVDEEIARLRGQGVDILREPEDDLEGRYRTAQIRDEGRHRIELREPLDDRGDFNPTGR